MEPKEMQSGKSRSLSRHEFKFIGKVGVELEGGWNESPSFTIHSDGSVHCGGEYKGEAHTIPKSTLKEVFDEIKAKYPDHIDGSCGLHVHVSLPELYYAYLTSKKFWEYFQIRMDTLHEMLLLGPKDASTERFRGRLDGGNQYCKKMFDPEKQVRSRDKNGNRYTQVNFCYALHNTLECRLFPMFEHASNAAMCVSEFTDTIETFLKGYKEKENLWTVVDVEETPKTQEEICV